MKETSTPQEELNAMFNNAINEFELKHGVQLLQIEILEAEYKKPKKIRVSFVKV